GSQALIQWLPRLRAACRVTVVTPTYGEHAPAWQAAGHEVIETATLPEASDCDVAVLTRPNNPDGALAAAGDLTALAAALADKGGMLVVDEAFADVAGGPSVAADIPAGCVALRSFGKFYGLAGLRLGFAISDPDTASRLTAALGPWPVSSLAAEIGAAALSDAGWQADTRQWLNRAASRLDGLLSEAGFDIVGGTDLFRLAASDAAPAVHDRLGRAGIYTRRFPDNARWLRFGLPGDARDWDRLEKALRP
ncbi:MAG: aminotransferase class I/II-fold pyridoxal phosphate-dependent enzyme, partial [Alphaproteobacteria bacterium]